MVANLTSGAIRKISTGKCTVNNIKPVVQVTYIHNRPAISDDEQWYWVMLSDGSFYQNGGIHVEAVRLNQLQIGSVVQLNDFATYTIRKITVFLINDFNVIHSECDLIGNPEPFSRNDTPLVERSTSNETPVLESRKRECPETQSRKRKHQSSNETPVLERSKPTIIDLDNSESDTNEDFDNGHHAQEPLAKTQKCSSHSLTQRKKRKRRSSIDNILKVVEDVSKMTKLMMKKYKEDDGGACLKKLETLEKDVSIMTKMMIEKNKEVDVGARFKKLETLEEDVSKLTRMMMEKNKEDVVGFNKLETLEEDVSKMTKMMMERNKEDDVGACLKKLGTLEENVSKLTRMVMEKNKEGVVGFNKLETLEEDVSKMKTMMMEKSKEDNVGDCFEKFEILEKDVSILTRMMMEKNKEDDMGACIEKLDAMGWGAEEPIYDTALLLFGQSADYRKLWLHLKPESCGKWELIKDKLFWIDVRWNVLFLMYVRGCVNNPTKQRNKPMKLNTESDTKNTVSKVLVLS
ncbi:Nucleic acid-binding, OB-fold [Artemisia annua]|uniref:Nucleic acid-binding, OB-fold n=1 Tax=Artemisia annua TaxID=35608 RepID=A0A2U1KN30_ARTAN|nr:Nucleic acid-binding, OB-fold [Artemisia annua]